MGRSEVSHVANAVVAADSAHGRKPRALLAAPLANEPREHRVQLRRDARDGRVALCAGRAAHARDLDRGARFDALTARDRERACLVGFRDAASALGGI
jgi:hypothetical protein